MLNGQVFVSRETCGMQDELAKKVMCCRRVRVKYGKQLPIQQLRIKHSFVSRETHRAQLVCVRTVIESLQIACYLVYYAMYKRSAATACRLWALLYAGEQDTYGAYHRATAKRVT